MARTYYTLAQRAEDDGKWYPQFGDYDREVVKSELDDYADHDVKKKNLKIVKSGDRQADVNAAVAKLNGEG